MKRDIRIHVVDFWFDDPYSFDLLKLFTDKYNFIIDSVNPDYLFFSVFENEHLKYNNSIKIFYSGENITPDFNVCDYGIAFDHLSFGDRYLRYPLHLMSNPEIKTRIPIDAESALNRKFCNFVYSNTYWANPIREEFFHQLSKYKQVDSGGRVLNNIGGNVEDKRKFIADYKFTIAFENSSIPGYTTEKIFDPLAVNSVPIILG